MKSALKAMKLTGGIPTLITKHNAWVKTPEKLMILLLLSKSVIRVYGRLVFVLSRLTVSLAKA